MTVTDSQLNSKELMLWCEPCQKPLKLLVEKPRHRPMRKGDRNRMLRAARRMKLRGII